MRTEVLKKIYSISLKSRILREWQKANQALNDDLTEKELLLLETIAEFSPVTEKMICKVLGLSPSSAYGMVQRLGEVGLVDLSEKARGKPLELSEKGRERLLKLKEANSIRLAYLLGSATEDDPIWGTWLKLLAPIEVNVGAAVATQVFGRFESDGDTKD